MIVMYLGPGLKGIVRHNQFFTYQPVEVMERANEVCDLAGHLFVSMEDIVSKKNELRRAGSFLNLTYQKIERAEKNRR